MDTFVADTLRAAVPGAAVEVDAAADMPTASVDRDHLTEIATALRDHPALQFALLVDVAGVDFFPVEPRFEVVYHFACLGDAYKTASATAAAPPRRFRLKVRAPGSDARVPTLTGLFPVANWLEREVFDLMGIAFEGHPDLRRILMMEDWTGHPLRKDYPVQIRKDTQAWQPIQLSPEEFAENVRAARLQAEREAGKK